MLFTRHFFAKINTNYTRVVARIDPVTDIVLLSQIEPRAIARINRQLVIDEAADPPLYRHDGSNTRTLSPPCTGIPRRQTGAPYLITH